MAEYVKLDDVIDALERTTWYHQAKNGEMVKGANSELHQPWYKEQDIYDAVQAIPAADVVEVRHGRWIEREDMYYGWNIWECSVCREEFCVEEGTPKDNEYNYCPNCGARMDGDGDA